MTVALASRDAGSGAGRAPALPATVTLDEVLKLLEERSPRTAAERAAVPVVAADRITAQTLPNPTLSYGGVHCVRSEHWRGHPAPGGGRAAAAAVPPAAGAARCGRRATSRPKKRGWPKRSRNGASRCGRPSRPCCRVRSSCGSCRRASNLQRVEQLVRARAAAGDRSQYRGAAHRDRDGVAAGAGDECGHRRRGRLRPAGRTARPARLVASRRRQPRRRDVSTDVAALWHDGRAPPALARGAPRAAGRRARRPVPGATGAVAGACVERRGADDARRERHVRVVRLLDSSARSSIAIRARSRRRRRRSTPRTFSLQAGLGEARAEIERAATVLKKRERALQSLEGAGERRLPTLRRMAEDAYREGSADILELLDAYRRSRTSSWRASSSSRPSSSPRSPSSVRPAWTPEDPVALSVGCTPSYGTPNESTSKRLVDLCQRSRLWFDAPL